ncbi:MAG: tetratricopeptide repeat protein [Asgard group archaeon]|nr:tetratricopeptide repeat protein [Asgard group archaeon]
MTVKSEIHHQSEDNLSIIDLERKIIIEGESKELLENLADGYYKKERFKRALNYYLKLLAYEAENAHIWNKLAVTFLKLEMFDQAIEMSKIAYRLINKKPNSV